MIFLKVRLCFGGGLFVYEKKHVRGFYAGWSSKRRWGLDYGVGVGVLVLAMAVGVGDGAMSARM